MAILQIARLGNPVLRRAARRVSPADLRSSRVQDLIEDMMDTMTESGGVGLAAPQVHVSLQIAVLGVQGSSRYPRAPRVPFMVLVNPVLSSLSREMEVDWEGCLSIPDLRGRVPRQSRIRVDALDRKGKKVSFEAGEFLARVIQHEADHLQGAVYLDRMEDFSSLAHLEEFSRFGEELSLPRG